ncbi:hypothetical protein GCM10010403_09830 [Glycomyces rutgersensis]|uniref:Uncharacterized protein n=1 Tax=Glycomyces rutgersensis TaxID=58115 RepID=A0ABP5S5T6_9ACTN
MSWRRDGLAGASAPGAGSSIRLRAWGRGRSARARVGSSFITAHHTGREEVTWAWGMGPYLGVSNGRMARGRAHKPLNSDLRETAHKVQPV